MVFKNQGRSDILHRISPEAIKRSGVIYPSCNQQNIALEKKYLISIGNNGIQE